jgi:hypothetical protein
MNAILREDWNSLVHVKGGPCASLYVALDPVGHEGMGDRLRLQKAAESAERQLLDRGYDRHQVTKLLQPVHDFPLTPSWGRRGKSMAILLGPNTSRFLKLTQPVAEEAWGEDHLHLRPLLPLVVESDRFYLLTISENRVQLYAGNGEELSPLDVAGLPKNLDEVTQLDVEDRGSQTHSANAGGLGRRGAIFHGHGGKADTAKISRQEYLQSIYDAIEPLVKKNPWPLVLAGVEEDVASWPSLARNVTMLEDFVSGNPDYAAVDELHERAWQIVHAGAKAEQRVAFNRLANVRGTAQAVSGLSQVLPAAAAGRVDTLFIDSRLPMSGRFDRTSGEVVVQHCATESRESDLLEDALRETVLHRGKVFPLDTSGELPVACEAVLRY